MNGETSMNSDEIKEIVTKYHNEYCWGNGKDTNLEKLISDLWQRERDAYNKGYNDGIHDIGKLPKDVQVSIGKTMPATTYSNWIPDQPKEEVQILSRVVLNEPIDPEQAYLAGSLRVFGSYEDWVKAEKLKEENDRNTK